MRAEYILFAVSAIAGGACTTSDRTTTAPPPAHDVGMVQIAAGSFIQGHDDGDRADERPAHEVHVDAFAIDATLVSRGDFQRFVDATKYVTTAESLGFGMAAKEGMRDWEWERVPHGSWRAPYIEGTPESDAFTRDDAPVVMVSFDDARAYCTHFGKRLPTESEWEYAMRAGRSGTRYPWGEAPERDGKLSLNFWQGTSHEKNLREDGFLYVSPVRAFAPNAWGIFDPVGNVWQWTADEYDPHAYAKAAGRPIPQSFAPTNAINESASDAGSSHPPKKQRVLRGGSWWCGACTCEGNGLFYRGHADPHAVFNNNGFRCAR